MFSVLGEGVALGIWTVSCAFDKGRVGVDDCCGQVEHRTDRDGVLKGRRVERYEGGSGMSETGGATKGELKGLLQQETTEDHKVVSVSVLGLHDACGGESGLVHEEDVVGLA